MENVNIRALSKDAHVKDLAENNPELKTLLEMYPKEHAEKILNNKDKLLKLAKAYNNIAASIATNALVMTCSEKCPFKDVCMFRKYGMAPDGSPCPVEQKIITELESDIVEYLDIDRSDPIEMEMLWDLIDTKIIDMRASADLKDGSVIQIVESTGKISSKKEEIDPAVLLKIELKKLKHSIIDSFVATRRSKKKYGTTGEASTIEALIMEAARKANE